MQHKVTSIEQHFQDQCLISISYLLKAKTAELVCREKIKSFKHDYLDIPTSITVQFQKKKKNSYSNYCPISKKKKKKKFHPRKIVQVNFRPYSSQVIV